MSLKLPTELVLLATVHGGVPIENGNVKTFQVPQGFTITRIMLTRPGICNVTSEYQVDEVVKTMNISPQKTVETLKTTQAEVLKSITQQLKGENENNELFKQYIRSRITTPTRKVFKSGDTMINKIFIRDASESINKAFDFKLNAINVQGIPDIFDFIYFGTSGPAVKTRSKFHGLQIDLSTLIESLMSYGVTSLILYDLTCSSFMSNTPMTERQEREVRRYIVQQGWGKKRTRRLKKKTKTRRARNRILQWTH